MILFIFQALLLGVVLMLFTRRSGCYDLYLTLFTAVWVLAVIVIRAIYGVDHASFYSSDQGTQIVLLNQFVDQGISLSLDRFIGGRYIVVAPVWLLNSIGFDVLLAFKFFQALSLLMTYRVCSDFIRTQGVQIKLWHAILFSGPLFIFLSALGLRDLQIVLCVSYFYIGRVPLLRFAALGVSGLLRPHLTVALVFAWLVGQLLKRHPLKRAPLALIAITVAAFVAGGFGFALGGFFKYQNNYVSPKLFTQEAWWRFFANLLGLQFLTFGRDVVRLTVPQLLTLRLFFVDTFMIPILFIFTLLNNKLSFSALRIEVFVSFVFFLGLVSQTNFNSSRQNLPFLSIMGVLALSGILEARKLDTQN
jgi:hypothetical protein